MSNYRPPQGYGQPPAQDPYNRPGSTTYGQQQVTAGAPGYTSPAPMNPSSQWAPPQNPHGQAPYQHNAPPQQQQSAAPAYNPNTYGAMPSQQSPVGPPLPPRHPQVPASYQHPQANPGQPQYQQPQQYGGQGGPAGQPQVGSLPQGYQAEVSQNGQWPQHPPYSQQPPTHKYEPQTQYGQGHGQPQGHQGMPAQQQQHPYNIAAPPPPSQTPGGSYFPPSSQGQAHPHQPAGPPPGHAYGVPQSPSTAGQGPNQFSQSNANPATGGYAQAPPQDPSDPHNKRFSYTPKPPPKPDVYGGAQQHQFDQTQGNQGYNQGQPQQQYHQQGQPQPPQQYGHYPPQAPATAGFQQQQQQQQHGGYSTPSPQQVFAQPAQQQPYPGSGQQGPTQYPSHSSPAQTYTAPPPPPTAPPNAQNQGWPSHPPGPPQYGQQQQAHSQQAAAPNQPQHGHSASVVQDSYNQTYPTRTDEPVSPLNGGRQSISFDRASVHRQSISGAPSRSDSQISRKSVPVSTTGHEPSIAEQRTTTPAPAPKTTTPGVSALGFGGPSDWEHFGMGADEIDDTAMYGTKSPEEDKGHKFATVELPASPVQEQTQDDSWRPSPAVVPVPLQEGRPSSIVQVSTPPLHGVVTPSPPVGHSLVQGQQQSHPEPAVVLDDPDYIPPMPPTPPPAGARANRPLIIGGSAPSQTHAPLPHATSIVMDESGWQPSVQPSAPTSQEPGANQSQSYRPAQPIAPPASDGFVMADGTRQPPSHGQMHPLQQPSYPLPQVQDGQALSKAHQEIEDLKARLASIETTLAQKDTELAQKSSELVQKSASISQTEAALNELREKWNAQKQLAESTDEQLKKAHAEHASLREKVTQSEIALTTAKQSHDGEKMDLQKKVDEVTAALATATAGTKALQLEVDTAKEKAAAPVDIAPGLDPWFKGSLQRCLDMLEVESKPLPVQEKMQVFMDFVNAEARLRGIDMPFGPDGQVKGFAQQQPQRPVTPTRRPEQPKAIQTAMRTSPKDTEGFVMVDSDADVQYSPGGRPIMKSRQRASTLASKPPAKEVSPTREMVAELPPASPPKPAAYQPFRRLSLETPPAGTSGSPPVDNLNKAIAIQPSDDQPAYKPFTYKPGEQAVVTPPATQPVVAPGPAPAAEPEKQPIYKPASATFTQTQPKKPKPEPTQSMKKELPVTSPKDETMLPQPLKPKPHPTPERQRTSSASGPTKVEDLATILPPTQMPDSVMSERLQAIRKGLSSYPLDFGFISELTKTWESQAVVTRSRLEAERRKRQAETEKRSNELYDDQEINYGDLEHLESQAKEEELEKKAQEDMEEYQSYGKEVFEPVFHRLHEQIRALQAMHDNTAALVRDGVSGRQALSLLPTETDLAEAMALLLQVHDALEARHTEVANAVKERDRRYKRTQTKPLYARGDIAKMKQVERGFETAERKNDVKATIERAERCEGVWKCIEAGMQHGIGENEDFAADVLAAAESASPPPSDELMKRARDVLEDVYAHTTQLMKYFEKADVALNECEYEVSVASAKLKGPDAGFFERLEKKKGVEDGKLREDSAKRLHTVEEHLKEALGRLSAVGGNAKGGADEDEEGKEERLKRALEEARRRNGEV